jgi:hypothetical protein
MSLLRPDAAAFEISPSNNGCAAVAPLRKGRDDRQEDGPGALSRRLWALDTARRLKAQGEAALTAPRSMLEAAS